MHTLLKINLLCTGALLPSSILVFLKRKCHPWAGRPVPTVHTKLSKIFSIYISFPLFNQPSLFFRLTSLISPPPSVVENCVCVFRNKYSLMMLLSPWLPLLPSLFLVPPPPIASLHLLLFFTPFLSLCFSYTPPIPLSVLLPSSLSPLPLSFLILYSLLLTNNLSISFHSCKINYFSILITPNQGGVPPPLKCAPC